MSPKKKTEQLDLEGVKSLIFDLQHEEKFDEISLGELAPLIEYAENDPTIQAIAKQLGLVLDPARPREFLLFLQQITSVLEGHPLLEGYSIPPKIAELVRDHEAHLAKEKEEVISRDRQRIPSLQEQINTIRQMALEKITQVEVINKAGEKDKLVEKPALAHRLSQTIAERVAQETPELAAGETFSSKTHQEKAERIINEELRLTGYEPLGKTATIAIAQATEPAARKIASLPHPTLPKEKVVFPEKPTPKPTFAPLPEEVAARLEKEIEGDAFQLAIKTPSLQVAILKYADENLSEAWQLMARGVFLEDIQASLTALEQAGLPTNHRLYQWLQAKEQILLREQKVEVDGELRDRHLAAKLKRYYDPFKRRGWLQVRDPQENFYYPRLSPAPKRSRFRLTLNRLAIRVRLYRPTRIGPGKTVLQPFFSPVKIFFRKNLLRLFDALKKAPLLKDLISGTKIRAARIAVRWGARAIFEKIAKRTISGLFSRIGSLFSDGISNLGKAFNSGLSSLGRNIRRGYRALSFAGEKSLGRGLLAGVRLLTGLTSLSTTGAATLAFAGILAVVAVFILFAVSFLKDENAFVTRGEPTVPLAENEYLRLTKTANPNRLQETDLPARVEYTIGIDPRQTPLTNVRIEESISVVPSQIPPTLTLESPDSLPTTIEGPVILNYSTGIAPNLNNSYIINTLTVRFTAPDGTESELEVNHALAVGTPPASDCPLPPGTYRLSCMSYVHPTNPCHGTNTYWGEDAPARDACGDSPPLCCFSIPYSANFPGSSDCRGPANSADPSGEANVCYGLYGPGGAYEGPSFLCPEFGYATDIAAPGSTSVSLPTINGQCVLWDFVDDYPSGATNWGWTAVFRVVDSCDTSPLPFNSYEMAFIHLNGRPTSCSGTTPCQSGTYIAGLNAATRHLHMEVRIDGQFIPPDNLCQ